MVEETNEIVEEKQQEITMYTFIDKETGKSNGSIQLSICKEATIANYKTNNHWYTESETCENPAIVVRFLRSEKKGMGRWLMAYGVLTMSSKNKSVKYSVLDDDSNSSTKIKENIYSKFGYTPTHAATYVNNNEVGLSGGEKQVLLTTFSKKANEYLFAKTRKSRSPETRRRSPSKGRSSSRKSRNSRAAEN